MNPDYDLIIIGGGPGGLSAAQYGARANLRTLVIEEMGVGGAVLLINDMENYPGFPEPVQGFDFSEKMQKQTENFGAEFHFATVNSVKKSGGIFTIETSDKTFTTFSAVLATGAKHKELGVPGENKFSGKGVSYCATCDGPFFKNKKILVVGGGDAACDEASYLANLTDTVILVHRRERFRAQKALAERIKNNPKIEVRFNHTVESIEGDTNVTDVILKKTDTKESYKESMDAVFIFIGSIPQTDLFPGLSRDDAGYLITDEHMETSLKGLFVVGDVRATPFRQVVVACGEGAIAAHSASAYIDELKDEVYADVH